MKCLFIISILIFFSFGLKIKGQDTIEMWTKVSAEIRFNFENSPWELRFRPDDHIFLPSKYVASGSLARIDLMVGINFWKFKFFDYTKYDQSGGFWTGPRLDFNFDLQNHKFLFNLQEQYFFGLNENSEDHYYLVHYIRYQTGKLSQVGVLSYGKWNVGRQFNKGIWFIGPTFELGEKSGTSVQVAFTKDIFYLPRYMTYVKVNFRLKIKDRSKPITIDEE